MLFRFYNTTQSLFMSSVSNCSYCSVNNPYTIIQAPEKEAVQSALDVLKLKGRIYFEIADGTKIRFMAADRQYTVDQSLITKVQSLAEKAGLIVLNIPETTQVSVRNKTPEILGIRLVRGFIKANL